MVKMTVEHALRVQAEQLDYYSGMFPNRADELRAKLAAETKAADLVPGQMYDVVIINRHVPRGGWFEANLPEFFVSEASTDAR